MYKGVKKTTTKPMCVIKLIKVYVQCVTVNNKERSLSDGLRKNILVWK